MGIGSRLVVLGGMALFWGQSATAQQMQTQGAASIGPKPMHMAPPGGDEELADAARAMPGQTGGSVPIRQAMSQQPAAFDDGEVVVAFRRGSSRLTPGATRRLDAFNHGMPVDGRFRIEGFADAAGTQDTRRDLAQRRAEAVASYLRMLGVARDRLVVSGHDADDALLDHSAKVTIDISGK